MKQNLILSGRSMLILIVALLLTVIAGLRLLGLDRDFEQYEIFYSLSDFQIQGSRFEPGFKWVAAFAHSLGLGSFGFMLLVACLAVPLKTHVLAKVSEGNIAPWIYYIPYFFVLQDMTAIRLGVASALMLAGVYMLASGKKLPGFLFVAASVLFHFQMLVPIIVFTAIFISDSLPPRYRRGVSVIVMIIAAVSVYAFARLVDLSQFGSTGEWASRYMDASGFGGAAWYQPIVVQSIFMLWFGRCAMQSREPYVRIAWFVGAFGVVIYYLMSRVGAAAFRLSEGLLFFNLLWIGYSARYARPMDRLMLKSSTILFALFYLWVFYSNEMPHLRLAERWSL